MSIDIKERITVTRLKLISRYPFFGYLLMQSGIYENNQIPTACTDGLNIYFNSEFFNSLSEKELEFVLCHEVLHLVLSHISRKGDRHIIRWNIAIDFATNEILHNANVGEAPPRTLYDPQFKGLCAEEIYEKIQVEEISICSCNSGSGSKKGKKKSKGSSSSGSDKGDENKDGVCPKCGGQGFDSHDYESIKGKEQEQEGKWKGVLETAAYKAKQKGNLPGGLEHIVNEILQPKIPWQTLLQRYLASRSKADFKWIPPNKRYIWQGIYLPRVHYDPSLKAVIVLDSSGSISDQELNEFVSEVIGMMRCGFDYTLWILTCDAIIQTTQKITKNQGYTPIQIKGRGGTSFKKPFEWIEKERIDADVLIYFTDLYGDFPDKTPNYPVIWIATTDEKVPFGTIFKYNREVK